MRGTAAAAARTCASTAASPARDIDGGYAEWAVADERYVFDLPAGYPDLRSRRCCAAG